jgi:hypothetical protein
MDKHFPRQQLHLCTRAGYTHFAPPNDEGEGAAAALRLASVRAARNDRGSSSHRMCSVHPGVGNSFHIPPLLAATSDGACLAYGGRLPF